jgi:hypothetical protein
LSAGLAVYLFASSAGAEPVGPGAVVVLDAPRGASWREGMQALVAELLTTGYELRVRTARAQSLDQLEQELQLQVAESGASAGVAVTREGNSAITLLCRHDAGACEHLETEISEGELSRSRLALAVVGRLRPLDLPIAPEPVAAPPPRVPPLAAPVRVKRPPEPPPKSARPHRLWLGGGAVLASGLSAPMTWLGASFALSLASPWGLELGFGGSPLRGAADSRAGSLSVGAAQAAGFATFEPWSKPTFGFALGIGGGALHLQETATPASGYDGFSRQVTVGLVSARARIFRRFGPIDWGLSVDPGMLVPGAKVVAGSQTLLQIGRPWVSVQTSLGIEL